MGKRSIGMQAAKGMFYINVGDLVAVQAEKSGRELTHADRKLFSKELRFPEVVKRHRFDPNSVTAEAHAALKDMERRARAERLATLVDQAEAEGRTICDLIEAPEYI